MSVITEPNTITGKQIGVTFAAEVEGVDFADLTAEVTDRIYDLLLQYGVLFFREGAHHRGAARNPGSLFRAAGGVPYIQHHAPRARNSFLERDNRHPGQPSRC